MLFGEKPLRRKESAVLRPEPCIRTVVGLLKHRFLTPPTPHLWYRRSGQGKNVHSDKFPGDSQGAYLQTTGWHRERLLPPGWLTEALETTALWQPPAAKAGPETRSDQIIQAVCRAEFCACHLAHKLLVRAESWRPHCPHTPPLGEGTVKTTVKPIQGPTKVRLVKAMAFPVVMYGCESLTLLNCGVGEDSWESLGLQGDPTSPS